MASTVESRHGGVRPGAAGRRTIDPVLAGQLGFPLLLIAVWQVTGMLAGDFYVATPVQAVDALADGVSSGWFFESLAATLWATAIGFAIALNSLLLRLERRMYGRQA